MRLRNKKTGEVVDLSIFGIELNIRKENQPIYHSIAELNEEWGDYKPAEPLLTREASHIFRDWAEMNMVDEVRCRYINDKIITFVDMEGTYVGGAKIDIPVNHASRKILKGEVYTITELCGEEE